MKQIVLKIVCLALIADTCKAAIILPTANRERNIYLHEAVIDVVMRCYTDHNNVVGVVGDTDGSIVRTLWTRHSISAVLMDSALPFYRLRPKHLRPLQVIVIVSTQERLSDSLRAIQRSAWWNHEARFLILSPTPDKILPTLTIVDMLYGVYHCCGMLNAQYIQSYGITNVAIFDCNPFTQKAPEPWKLSDIFIAFDRDIYLFYRLYRKEEQACEASNIVKTTDIAGSPFHFMTTPQLVCQLTKRCSPLASNGEVHVADEVLINYYKWFIDRIAGALNASVVIVSVNDRQRKTGICIMPGLLSSVPAEGFTFEKIYSYTQTTMYAMTQHTAHMTQLDKILSVTDGYSRIGTCLVYFITFLFFKFFLRQAVMPAVLNLVRLTCNTGLPRLPNNLAPTIYLSCLFMCAINLQAIYTGNLASLLTTTIAYPHVNTNEDIPKLGYTVYAPHPHYPKIAADPILHGRVIKMSLNDSYISDKCTRHVLGDPLAACIVEGHTGITDASRFNLHLSRDPIGKDYNFYLIWKHNPFESRIRDIMNTWHEAGLYDHDKAYETLHSAFVDDDDVKKNMVWRVMTLTDLQFAFVILGIGLTCSFVCFVAEILISYLSSKFAKRRDTVHPILACSGAKKKRSWFPAFKLRFNRLRLP